MVRVQLRVGWDHQAVIKRHCAIVGRAEEASAASHHSHWGGAVNRIVCIRVNNNCAPFAVWVSPCTNIAGAVLTAVVVHVSWHLICVTTTYTDPMMNGAFLGGSQGSAWGVATDGFAGGGVAPVTVTTEVDTVNRTSGAIMERGRPRSQATELPPPCQILEATSAEPARPGRHELGTQKVKPDARTSIQDESTDARSWILHETTAAGTGELAARAQAQQRASITVRDRVLRRIRAPVATAAYRTAVRLRRHSQRAGRHD